MNVTLRKAHALSKALLEAAKKVPLNRTTTISVYDDEDVDDRVTDAGSALVDATLTYESLIGAAYRIRDLISTANHKAKVDDLLNEKASLEATEKMLAKVLGEGGADYDYERATDPNIAGAKMQAIHERNANTERTSSITEDLTVKVLTDDIKGSLADRLHVIRKRKTAIADELLSLNTGTHVILDRKSVEVLTENKLI